MRMRIEFVIVSLLAKSCPAQLSIELISEFLVVGVLVCGFKSEATNM